MSPAFPLAADDTALVTKLQDVRDHLNEELKQLNTLIERKTLQLRGIESILEDATGAATNGKAAAPEAPAIAPLAAPETSTDLQWESVAPAPEVETEEAVPETEAAVPPAVVRKPRRAKAPAAEKSPPAAEKTTAKSTKSKPPIATKPPAAKSKQSAPKSEPPTAKPTELRQALQPQFQGKTLSEAVGEVLAKASEPLTARDVATELYEGLTLDDLKRAVKTVATILAGGRAKGDWQSSGKGLYQAGGTQGESILGAAALSGVA
ncbi:MAG TPA: hypothetical protein V6D18_04120 [Thermosynechococcaceae cyanobacterium]